MGLTLLLWGNAALAQIGLPEKVSDTPSQSVQDEGPLKPRSKSDVSENMPLGPTIPTGTPPQGLPFRTESVVPTGTLTRVVLVTLVGLALVFVAVYFLKGYLFRNNRFSTENSRMQLIEVRRLSQRLTLFMVRVDDKTMVLAQSGDQLLTLDPGQNFCSLEEGKDGDEV